MLDLASLTHTHRHGRTETIRPATAEAKICAELMQPSHPASTSDMMNAVVTATKKHFDLTRNAAMGRPHTWSGGEEVILVLEASFPSPCPSLRPVMQYNNISRVCVHRRLACVSLKCINEKAHDI